MLGLSLGHHHSVRFGSLADTLKVRAMSALPPITDVGQRIQVSIWLSAPSHRLRRFGFHSGRKPVATAALFQKGAFAIIFCPTNMYINQLLMRL